MIQVAIFGAYLGPVSIISLRLAVIGRALRALAERGRQRIICAALQSAQIVALPYAVMDHAQAALQTLLSAGVAPADPRCQTLAALIARHAAAHAVPARPAAHPADMAFDAALRGLVAAGLSRGMHACAPAEEASRRSSESAWKAAGKGGGDHVAFQIKAQVDALRRVVRGADVPELVAVAAAGKGDAVPREGGPVVDMSRGSVVRLGKQNAFRVHALPVFPSTHVFTEADVIMPGEGAVGDEELRWRLLCAETRHRRMYAEGAVGSGGRTDVASNATPAPVRPRVANGPVKEASAERPRKAERRRELVSPSRLRSQAAAPIAVAAVSAETAPQYAALRAQREQRFSARVELRRQELAGLPGTLPDHVRRLAVIEAKQLKLVELQRQVRSTVSGTMHKVLSRGQSDSLDRATVAKFRRPAPVHWSVANRSRGPARTTNGLLPPDVQRNAQRMGYKHRAEHEARQRARQATIMRSLWQHAQEFRTASYTQQALRKKLLKDLDRYFRDKLREEERRKKKEQTDRLRALRNNNEDEYLELLKTTKNKRLIQLLKQTDEYLMQIGAQVERQKQKTRADDGPGAAGASAPLAAQAAEGAKPALEVTAVVGDDNDLQAMKQRRNDYYTITHTISEKVRQPDTLVGGKLKHYQLEGLEWLVSLYNNNLNGILADEMGLGKTIQTLSLISYLVEVKHVPGPYLIIVPLSVMSNWVRELDLWAPSLIKVVYRGDPSTRKNIQMYEMAGGNYNVLLTTYEFVVKDKNVLGKVRWKYIIMDEGHRMKNADCKLALVLGAKYISRNRLLLTGTPLQNNMTELWALLNFLLPTIFSSSETFETWFNAPFQASSLGGSAELNEEENLLVISRLHQVLRPFMLRRLKTDVESQLPDKVEIVFRCDMSIWQRTLYRQMRARLGIAAGKANGGVRSFNNMVMQLKKVCNHPYLFYNEEELSSVPHEYLVRASGKFALLEHTLKKLKATGHRVLMFSQMTAALDYLQHFLNSIGMKHLRLDGTTKADDRQDMLEMFNAADSEYFCFLLSTRAGGLGLNLQTADTVIIFDSDWNPMMDLQAQDRAHRIGQTKEVRVYRLICSGSIEVKILERANRKLHIDAQVIQAGQFNNKSSDNDRTEMLKDILRQQADDDGAQNADVNSAEEINRMLARSDEEFDIFEEMDRKEFEERDGRPRLIMDESELPDWVLLPEVEKKSKEQLEAEYINEHGRGQRKRKDVTYNDNLTEREWAETIEAGEEISDAVRRKRRRLSAAKYESDSAEDGEIVVKEDDGHDGDSMMENDVQFLNGHSGTNVQMKPQASDSDGQDSGTRVATPMVTTLAPFVDPELNNTSRRRSRNR